MSNAILPGCENLSGRRSLFTRLENFTVTAPIRELMITEENCTSTRAYNAGFVEKRPIKNLKNLEASAVRNAGGYDRKPWRIYPHKNICQDQRREMMTQAVPKPPAASSPPSFAP